jgi:hypothetical protein
MTEAEWLRYFVPTGMLPGVSGRARKLRLFACATCRRLWFLLTDPRSRAAVEAAERFADGLIGAEELAAAAALAERAAWEAEQQQRHGWNAALTAARAATPIALDAARRAAEAGGTADEVREVFGNPFRPLAVAPAWLAWEGGAVPRIARSIDEEGRWADLPILGDALEDAGCADAAVLEHCHSGERHSRGCWVVDAVLGRE